MIVLLDSMNCRWRPLQPRSSAVPPPNRLILAHSIAMHVAVMRLGWCLRLEWKGSASQQLLSSKQTQRRQGSGGKHAVDHAALQQRHAPRQNGAAAAQGRRL